MKKVSNPIRRDAIRLSAFILALTVGIVADKTWQSISSRVSNKPFYISQHRRPVRITDVCEVHGERMTRKYVSILAGLPGYPINDTNYLTAKEWLFPNSNFFIIDRSRSVTEGHAEVNVCSKCRVAERTWMENH